MKITYWGTDNKFAKAEAEDGYKITCYDEETQDIVFFACYTRMTCLTKKLAKYYEITDEKAEELTAKRELALHVDEEDALNE